MEVPMPATLADILKAHAELIRAQIEMEDAHQYFTSRAEQFHLTLASFQRAQPDETIH